MNNLYDENSIKTESAREFTRRVPSTYLGSSKTNTNLVKEVFANAVDEYTIGHGNLIKINVDESTNTYSIEDNGQGFLVNAGIDEDGETILQRSFDKINTSGKTTEDGVYNGTALGLNGIGAKLTNWLSTELDVITYRDGQSEHIWFKDGIFDKREVKSTNHASGTVVTWHPDPQFFKENKVDNTTLTSHFEVISAMCPDLAIEYNYNGNVTTYSEPGGLNAYVANKTKKTELLSNRFYISRAIKKDVLNICITYTSDYSEHIDAYVNLGHTDAGAHIAAFHTALAKAINKCAIDKGLLKKNDKNFSSYEISEGLYVVFNLTTTSAKYDAQNKSRIDDVNAKIINTVMSGDFATWLSDNPETLRIITERAITARKAREASQKAKEKIRNVSKKSKSIFVDLPSKLSDAYPKHKKDRSQCELYICEGDSAASSINAVKDSSFQATFPIRGKILNCQKATPDKVYSNAEIANITKALGLDVDKSTGKLVYNPKKLRYNKIIIATDADPDGDLIATLLCTVFNWLCPELFEHGHIYRVYGALFKVTFNDGTYKLFQSEDKFNEWKTSNKQPYTVSRAKGLGEMTKEETAEQLTDPSTRNIQNLEVADYALFEKYLEVFEGADVSARKRFYETGVI